MTCATRCELGLVLQETELLDVAVSFAHRNSKHRSASVSHLGRPQIAAADLYPNERRTHPDHPSQLTGRQWGTLPIGEFFKCSSAITVWEGRPAARLRGLAGGLGFLGRSIALRHTIISSSVVAESDPEATCTYRTGVGLIFVRLAPTQAVDFCRLSDYWSFPRRRGCPGWFDG